MNKPCSQRTSSIVITFPEGVEDSYTPIQQESINNQARKRTKLGVVYDMTEVNTEPGLVYLLL